MRIKVFQIDAFACEVFKGNSAAVCPVDTWLPGDVMQKIAAENNLSETAFFVKNGECYDLRWFTPAVEVALCGHATLATAWVLVNELKETISPIRFMSMSGELKVFHSGEYFTLDFPTQKPTPIPPPDRLLKALGISEAEVFTAEDYLVVLKNEAQIRSLSPDFSLLKGLPLRGVIVTAPGETVDFVSRWFGPNVGVNEDPVTGSAHTTLTPYWSKRLKKVELKAKQISERGGELLCVDKGERTHISGKCVKYMEGWILI